MSYYISAEILDYNQERHTFLMRSFMFSPSLREMSVESVINRTYMLNGILHLKGLPDRGYLRKGDVVVMEVLKA